MKRCPNCGSTKISINESAEFYCKACGYVNSKLKRACFIDFEEVFGKPTIKDLH